MKLVLNGTKEFEVSGKPNLSGDPIYFPLSVNSPSDIPSTITGGVLLKDKIVWPKTGVVEVPTELIEEDGIAFLVDKDTEKEPQDFILFETKSEDWLRYYVSGNRLYFTNIPIVSVPESTEEELEEERNARFNKAKEDKIGLSKIMLSEYLKAHPFTWVDGNQYSVTQEKQSQLTSNIALYQIAVAAGQPYELKWNTTGDVCTVWTIENLSALALAIGAYVQPLVSYQQTTEVAIKECQSMAELEAIVIDYDSVFGTTKDESTEEPPKTEETPKTDEGVTVNEEGQTT